MAFDGAALNQRSSTTAKVVVATTVALSFISFWRGAAIVLSDLASSCFYAGGIAEQAIGASAPWFVLGVMLFSFAVRSVYMESCSMFVRGGVYVVVRDSMGPFVARLSVSSLVFDYMLTGPISVVSAGQYLGRLLNEISARVAALGATTLGDIRRAPARLVGLSPHMETVRASAKEFLYACLYNSPGMEELHAHSERVVAGIFAALMADPTLMPADHQEQIATESLARTVADYIAGMTDTYIEQLWARCRGIEP